MADYKIENLSFAYPNRKNKALDNISLTVRKGEFITLCGKSGCGKTTLLRLLKSTLAPEGDASGNIYFRSRLLSEAETREQSAKIGFVMQNVDNQIVTDKVWHELAFGLESLGYSTSEIRTRVSEMASFFGIQTWFHKKVTELSGGQKQILNLASVMVMQPSVIILDEPTSQLDPIAASEFLRTLERINREIGTTVILSEHRLEEAFAVSDRVIVMDGGKVIADDNPKRLGAILKNHDMYCALPVPALVHGAVENDLECPVTVREGREWLEKYSQTHLINSDSIPKINRQDKMADIVIEIKDAWFRYEKNLPDVIKGLNVKINQGELFAIVGGNGTGKTTALSLICALNAPYRGDVLINGESVLKVSNLYNGILGVLPQNPRTLFVKKTVSLDLFDILSGQKLSKKEQEKRVESVSKLCRIENLLQSHPYDLSGGEQQRAALAKVLLLSPKILLMDEPTKGFDACFKQIFADILSDLKANGVTVVMVSHDIEFCAEYADRCAMFFDGNITSIGEPREFFAGKSFYTTSANRMARGIIPAAVTAEDIIAACGGIAQVRENAAEAVIKFADNKEIEKKNSAKIKKRAPVIVLGIIFALLCVLTCAAQVSDFDVLHLSSVVRVDSSILQLITIIEIAAAFICLLPQKESCIEVIQQPRGRRKLPKRTMAAAAMILLAIPLTIYIGVFYLQDRKYYFISLLVILETIIPFFMVFEGRKPKARELVVISVLCAIAIAGRTAFFMIPQFKPMAAVIIIAGVCFGGEAGFLVGAVTGFVSNFFFGQGPWTPWQMFALGIIGFLAGVFFNKGVLRKRKVSLCVFGFFAAIIVYGLIMNSATVIIWQGKPTGEMFISSYIMGFPFDLVHGASTAFFLWVIAEPMIEKIDRIKIKYGLISDRKN